MNEALQTLALLYIHEVQHDIQGQLECQGIMVVLKVQG